MTNLLIRLFIKDYKNVEKNSVREKYGFFASTIGILTNIVLVTIKLIIGVFTASISIIADAVNNLSDAASSIITLIGFKISAKKADENHPFGHERMEYITGLIVSMIILLIGCNFLITSVQRIFKPGEIKSSNIVLIILGISIIIKLWQSHFYKKMGKKINSKALIATSKDSRNDCLATFATLISILIFHLFGVNIDAYIGTLVSIFILISGIGLVIDTSSSLIGDLPSLELVEKILKLTRENQYILGHHDLVIHSYGPNKYYATIHLEFDYKEDILFIHDIVDNIEKKVYNELGIQLVVHMDPTINDDEETNEIKGILPDILEGFNKNISFHDLRLVKGPTHTNILFDCVIPLDEKVNIDELKLYLWQRFKAINPKYELVVVFDDRLTYK